MQSTPQMLCSKTKVVTIHNALLIDPTREDAMQPVLTFRGHQMVSVTRNEGKSCLFF